MLLYSSKLEGDSYSVLAAYTVERSIWRYIIAPGHGRDLSSLEPAVSGTRSRVLGLGANVVDMREASFHTVG